MGRMMVNLSGGVDSTYVTWRYLKDHPSHNLLIHHCNLENKQHRSEAENKAVHNILQWFNDQGLENYEYVETSIDYTSIKKRIWDIEVIGFFIGLILSTEAYQDVDEVLMCATRSDMNLSSIGDRQKRRADLIRIFNPGRNIKLSYPIKHMYKRDLIQAMPKELFQLTWSCRKPKDGKPCGKCSPCKGATKRKSMGIG